MILGLPWWLWFPLAVTCEALTMMWRWAGTAARCRHRLTCRVYWQVTAILHAATIIAWCAAMWGSVLGYVFIGFGVLGEAYGLWEWTQGIAASGARELTYRIDGVDVKVRKWPTVVDHVREAWAHRKHDDDCEHGPTKRWHGSTAKLQTWRKVALNPDFAPS